MTETLLLNQIRKETSQHGVRLFRNNIGIATYLGNVKVVYGLHPGSSDLIGWKTVKVTPEMVGKDIAVFVSIECKTLLWKPRSSDKTWQKQKKWLRAVRDAGGIAIVARSVSEALEELRKAF